MKAKYTSPETRIILTERIAMLAASPKGTVNTGNGNGINITDNTEDSSGGRAKPTNFGNWDDDSPWG